MSAKALKALSSAKESLLSAQGVLREFKITRSHLATAYDNLRKTEKNLWEAKRLLGKASTDRFVTYEIQDILTNSDSEASLPQVLAALRTIHRLVGRGDDIAKERVDSTVEKVLVPGIGSMLDRVVEIIDRLS